MIDRRGPRLVALGFTRRCDFRSLPPSLPLGRRWSASAGSSALGAKCFAERMWTGGVGGGSFAGLQHGVVAPVKYKAVHAPICSLRASSVRSVELGIGLGFIQVHLTLCRMVCTPPVESWFLFGGCCNVRSALTKGHGCVGSLARRVVFRFRLSNSTAGDAVTDVEGVRGGRLRPKTQTTDGFKDAGPCAGK